MPCLLARLQGAAPEMVVTLDQSVNSSDHNVDSFGLGDPQRQHPDAEVAEVSQRTQKEFIKE
jgi:hypothetical protein